MSSTVCTIGMPARPAICVMQPMLPVATSAAPVAAMFFTFLSRSVAEIAATLRKRKVGNIEATGAALVATGNIGCMTQIGGGTKLPVVHTVELLDWAWGGPKPVGVPDAVPALVAAE